MRDVEVRSPFGSVDFMYNSILTLCIQHVATLASVLKAKEYGYPKKDIDDNWEKLLLNQCALLISYSFTIC